MEPLVVGQEVVVAVMLVVLCLFAFLAIAGVVAVAFFFLMWRRQSGGVVFQAPADFLSADRGIVGPESGDRAFQAPGGEDGLTEAEVRARREYAEAMKIVDRQVERATRQVLSGKPTAHSFTLDQFLNKGDFSGPHQASAPGVKDE